MKEPKRYDYGNGEGMFDNKKGDWISYEEHKEIVNKLKEREDLVKNCSIPDVSKRFNYTNFQAGMYFGIIIMIIIFHIAIKTPAIK